jgi:hypothetical protein
MTTALATTADVEKSLGRSLLAGDETNRATTLLLLASSAYEIEAEYHFAPGSYTVGRQVRKGKVKLPAKSPTVTAVRSVDQTDGTVTTLSGYTTHGSWVYRLESSLLTRPVRDPYVPLFVEIDFTVDAEDSPIPPVIVTLVANCVARTLAGPPVGAASESAGPFQISYVNSSGDIYISKNDRLILSRYKQPRAAISLQAHAPGDF